MNILVALVLLIWLLSRAGKKCAARPVPKKPAADELDWIDELEFLDAATDDFV